MRSMSRVLVLALVALLACSALVLADHSDTDFLAEEEMETVTEFLEQVPEAPVTTEAAPIEAEVVDVNADVAADTTVDPLEELSVSAETALSEDPEIDSSQPVATDDPELEVSMAAAAPLVGASSPCARQGGTCKSTSQGCGGGGFHSGLCPGAAHIKCCKPHPQPASPCTRRGGNCRATSQGCSGHFQSGLCPGAANIKCCMSAGAAPPSSPASSACGPYAGAAVSGIRGNGGRTYGVVRIARQHLSNPGSYGQSSSSSDNTLTVSTACAFNAMHNAARAAGVHITINSGFRTLARQQYFWNCYRTKRCNGGNLAAAPGTSNHGIGLAVDLNASGRGVYNWLRNNAHKFGFVRTVPRENWHWEHRVGWRRASYT